MKNLNSTAHEILDLAEQFTQTRGFNAFSYKDLQNEIGIKTSSIHYYFPSKSDLAYTMTERYIERFKNALELISAENRNSLKGIRKHAQLHIDLAADGKFCLCGILASEIATMTAQVTELINQFFDLNNQWISNMLKDGIEKGKITPTIDPDDYAKNHLALLHGAALIAIAKKDNSDDFEKMIDKNLKQISL